MYATVMTPKIAPGISFSMLYCASRVASLTSAAWLIDAIPASLASVVDAFISNSSRKFGRLLCQRQQRADDISEREQSEHYAGQFAQQTVLREPGSCGGFDCFVDVGDHCESCFVGCGVHFQVLLF